MTFSKILVPYDDSKYSTKAFEKAIELASKFSSEIILLNVIEAKQSGEHTVTSLDKLEDIQDKQVLEATSILEDLKKDVKENISITIKVLHNPSISDGIVSFVKSNNVDLIVMGSHGRTGLKKLVLGSVANNVVANAKCHVLIIKGIE